MRILITGGCGFVGSNLALFLKKNLERVNIASIDNLYRKGSEINEKRLKACGIKNLRINIEDNSKIIKLPKYDLIIDCCAEPSVEKSKYNFDKIIYTNLIGTYNILKKCIKDKCNIIFLSSSRVYSIEEIIKNFKKNRNKKNNLKIDETFSTSKIKSLYGFSKLSSEELIKEICYLNPGIKYIINRFGVIAGPWQFGKQDQGFVTLWIARHIIKKKLNYIGFGATGKQSRDIIHIADVCDIILKQIKSFKKIFNQTFNIGGGKTNYISLKKLTLICENITKNKIEIGKVFKTSNYDIPYFLTNNSKIIKIYKWEPKRNIKLIVKDIYEWLINNNQILRFFKS